MVKWVTSSDNVDEVSDGEKIQISFFFSIQVNFVSYSFQNITYVEAK